MSITKESELQAMKEISFIVALTLKKMREFAAVGMTTLELDQYGSKILASYGAKSAPKVMYDFPRHTCICINEEVAHGIPSKHKIIKQGDLVNIDVSAELGGFYSDNGGSFVIGEDIQNHTTLVNLSKEILKEAIGCIKTGVLVSKVGFVIENNARKNGCRVIRNLAGHGVGRSLHESPKNILNFRDRFNRQRFKKNSIVAVETFISTISDNAVELNDGWTLVGDNGGYVAQHEHTIMVTDNEPLILTAANEIWN